MTQPQQATRAMNQHITFTETAYGHYLPVVVAVLPTGAESVRELTKADLTQFETADDSVVDGYLYKKGINHKNWTKRYFILHEAFLFYFHDSQDTKPIGVLPLKGCQVEIVDHKRFEEQPQQQQLRHGFAFKIIDNTPKKKVFNLLAETQHERQHWVDAITGSIQRNEAQQAAPTVGTRSVVEDMQINFSPAKKRASLAVMRAAVLSNNSPEPTVQFRTPLNTAAMSSPQTTARRSTTNIRKPAATGRSVASATPPTSATSQRDRVRDRDTAQLQAITVARVIEEECPITFAELFRNQIFTLNVSMCEEPHEQCAVNIPHMKGDWAEQILIDVYRRYCSPQGYMDVEGFTTFLNEAAIVNSHVPRSDDDEPDELLQRMLQPTALMSLLPRELGVGAEDLLAASKVRLNFTQFFFLLVNMASIVYEELYEESMSQATGRLLHEMIVPLYTWAQGHDKRGSSDDAVIETRILLLIQAYASNLWIVFLYYATDNLSHMPSLSLPFPGAAQYQEKLLHGLPKGIIPSKAIGEYLTLHDSKVDGVQQSTTPHSKGVRKVRPSALFVTESSALRFAREYGIMPQLLSRAEVRELYQQSNRPKNRTPDRRLFSTTHATMHDGGLGAAGNAAMGLSFSEFAEVRTRVDFLNHLERDD